MEEEKDKLLNMEEHLHRRIVGQEEAISALARAIRRSRAGLKSPLRPVGSFIFLGPTGVGKTEVARTLAEFLFGNERALLRFDMSEYINSIDDIIVFAPLSEDHLQQVWRLRADQLTRPLFDKKIRRVPAEGVYKWLVETTCQDRSYGARPLRRAIQRHIEDALSESLILGTLPRQGEIEIFLDQERLAFREAMEINTLP